MVSKTSARLMNFDLKMVKSFDISRTLDNQVDASRLMA